MLNLQKHCDANYCFDDDYSRVWTSDMDRGYQEYIPVELFYYIDVDIVIWAISMYIVDLVTIDWYLVRIHSYILEVYCL